MVLQTLPQSNLLSFLVAIWITILNGMNVLEIKKVFKMLAGDLACSAMQ
jgi:hypothetical protein